MAELIIIKTNNGKEVQKFLEANHISYEVYQEPEKNWENQEKKALQEWEKLSDEELITEWEKLPNNDRENN